MPLQVSETSVLPCGGGEDRSGSLQIDRFPPDMRLAPPEPDRTAGERRRKPSLKTFPLSPAEICGTLWDSSMLQTQDGRWERWNRRQRNIPSSGWRPVWQLQCALHLSGATPCCLRPGLPRRVSR